MISTIRLLARMPAVEQGVLMPACGRRASDCGVAGVYGRQVCDETE